jgi:ABC-2 type transporter
LLVIASIHQPSTAAFTLFDKLLLLSGGRTAYNGPVSDVREHFSSLGYEMPQYINPAEFIIELVNTDFMRDEEKAQQQLDYIQDSWDKSGNAVTLVKEIQQDKGMSTTELDETPAPGANPAFIPFTLTHRSFIKAYRDVIAYGIRIAMYMGLAIMMGTVWLRLKPTQGNIQNWINSLFFGGAFLSFMAVAYIPAYIEDLNLFKKERANGLYGPTAFLISNFITGLIPLFIITILFSVIVYWLSNFRPAAEGFWMFVMWLFLDLLAAESLVVLITSLCPIFVVALAATAFANGLWMSVDGFMVNPKNLNVFWKDVFSYIDYQAYVFKGSM